MEFFNHWHCKYTGIKGFLTVYNDAIRYGYMITQKSAGEGAHPGLLGKTWPRGNPRCFPREKVGPLFMEETMGRKRQENRGPE